MKPTPREIVDHAISEYRPVAIRAGFSGGRDSLATCHWMMENVPGCELFHCNTGIGIERTREYVRDICRDRGWPLHEIRAKEDCGQDYDELVLERGFPGPGQHGKMYSRLKERAIYLMVKRAKVGHSRNARVLIASGLRHDESIRRMGYVGREVNKVRAQVWVNAIYWWSESQRDAYIALQGLPINPISAMLGMSGECLCGAFAHPGEKQLVKLVCPQTFARIEALEQRVSAAGFNWGWEGKPPKGGHNPAQTDIFRPLCVGCEKVHGERAA